MGSYPKSRSAKALGIIGGVFLATSANAFVLDFGTNEAVGGFNISEEAQTAIGSALQVEVLNTGGDNYAFNFTSTDTTYDSSITDIYFGLAPTFGDYFTYVDHSESAGVAFSEGASPSDPPPGGPSNVFASFAMDSDSPAATNGIESGESLTVNFTSTLSILEIEDFFADGSLEIQMHVQSIDGGEGGQSQYFVSNPPTSVSEPASMLLLGLGLIGLGVVRRAGASRA